MTTLFCLFTLITLPVLHRNVLYILHIYFVSYSSHYTICRNIISIYRHLIYIMPSIDKECIRRTYLKQMYVHIKCCVEHGQIITVWICVTFRLRALHPHFHTERLSDPERVVLILFSKKMIVCVFLSPVFVVFRTGFLLYFWGIQAVLYAVPLLHMLCRCIALLMPLPTIGP